MASVFASPSFGSDALANAAVRGARCIASAASIISRDSICNRDGLDDVACTARRNIVVVLRVLFKCQGTAGGVSVTRGALILNRPRSHKSHQHPVKIMYVVAPWTSPGCCGAVFRICLMGCGCGSRMWRWGVREKVYKQMRAVVGSRYRDECTNHNTISQLPVYSGVL